MAKTQPIFDKKMARQMVRMFDSLYRFGVSHCYSADDEGLCREFLEATYKPGVYGVIEDGYYISAREWQLRLQKLAGTISMKSPMYVLFGRMGNYLSNYLGCFMPLAQDFYNKGVSDYLSYGHKADMAIFNSKNRVWLTEKGIKRASDEDYKQAIQQYCYDRKRMETTFMEGYVDERTSKYQRIKDTDPRKCVRNPRHYENFVVCIGVLTQRDEY